MKRLLKDSLIQSEVLCYGDVVDNLKEVYENVTYEDVLKFNNEVNLEERSILVLNPKE